MAPSVTPLPGGIKYSQCEGFPLAVQGMQSVQARGGRGVGGSRPWLLGSWGAGGVHRVPSSSCCARVGEEQWAAANPG